jgi:glutaminyl-peptide cyclotransferase
MELLVLAVVLALSAFNDDDNDGGRAVASGPAPTPKVDRFDEARAMRLVRLQLAVGQRPAGSPQLRRLAVRLEALLPDGRFEDVPGHPGLRNVVGELPGREPAVVLGAHYDSEYHPAGFVGANDSAAGTAAVLEIARALQRIDRRADAPAIRFVLFDGEEEAAPTEDFYRDALRGSKAYVTAHGAQVRALLLLDYIANKGLRLPHEATSTPKLWNLVRTAAARVGVGKIFADEAGHAIVDDHTPFLKAGIPAVDFIDWSYPYRDGLQDTYDKLSSRSMDAVGETVVDVLLRWKG